MPDLTQAPTRVFLGGTWYTLSVLTDVDIEELNNWLRSDIIHMAEEAITDDMPPERARAIREVAFDKAQTVSWISGEGAKMMATLNGISRVLWQGLRHNHPELSHKDVHRLITNKKTLDYALKVWKLLNIAPAVNGKEVAPQEGAPKASRRRRRSR